MTTHIHQWPVLLLCVGVNLLGLIWCGLGCICQASIRTMLDVNHIFVRHSRMNFLHELQSWDIITNRGEYSVSLVWGYKWGAWMVSFMRWVGETLNGGAMYRKL